MIEDLSDARPRQVSAGGGHFVSGVVKIDYNAALDEVSARF